MMQYTHLGSYGLIVKEGKIVLIKKVGGPYDGMLDLPGGTIEYGEEPSKAVIRELKEEVGIIVTDYELFDANSVVHTWNHKGNLEKIHHIGVFYIIKDYDGEIKENVELDDINNDSLGAKFYSIENLNRNDLSPIALMEVNKLGYKFNDNKCKKSLIL